MKSVYYNKKVKFDYEILKSFEAGIVLEGWEVKSVKNGNLSLKNSFVREISSEIFLSGARIGAYRFGESKAVIQETKDRKLLLSRKEISDISAAIRVSGQTVVPLEVYINDKKLIKVKIVLARGQKKFDKRSKLKQKDMERRLDMDRKFYKI